jgi:hypothetical protein
MNGCYQGIENNSFTNILMDLTSGIIETYHFNDKINIENLFEIMLKAFKSEKSFISCSSGVSFIFSCFFSLLV